LGARAIAPGRGALLPVHRQVRGCGRDRFDCRSALSLVAFFFFGGDRGACVCLPTRFDSCPCDGLHPSCTVGSVGEGQRMGGDPGRTSRVTIRSDPGTFPSRGWDWTGRMGDFPSWRETPYVRARRGEQGEGSNGSFVSPPPTTHPHGSGLDAAPVVGGWCSDKKGHTQVAVQDMDPKTHPREDQQGQTTGRNVMDLLEERVRASKRNETGDNTHTRVHTMGRGGRIQHQHQRTCS